MNRTAVFLAFVAMAALGFIGIILIAHFRPDATATIISTVTNLLGLISAFAAVAYTLVKVEKNTNGRLSTRDERIKELEHMLIKEGVNPHESQKRSGGAGEDDGD